MRNFWQDIRHGLKLLVKNPAFTAVAIFSLALGIGLNSVIFCLVDLIILQPLPVDRPEELAVFSIRGERGALSRSLAYPEYLEFRNQCQSFSGILGMQRRGAILTNGETSELVSAEAVTGNYFTILGLKPFRGRFFHDGEFGKGNEPVAVLSYGFWQRRFGGDLGIIGKAVELSRWQVTVLGIAPKNFHGAQRPFSNTNVWFPAEQFGGILAGPKAEQFDLLGRVAAGVTIERAQAEVDTIARRLAPNNPDAGKFLGAGVKSEREEHLERFGKLGVLVMLITGLVLLIACVNVSNLLLARSQVRRGEIAIRLALGSSRRRLMRQLLTESLVLSLVASAIGLLLTRWAVQALPAFLPPMPMQLFPEISPDARVVGFAIGMAFITTLIFALIPSFHASRLNLVGLLKESADTGKGGRRYLGRNALVVGQLCISLVLLTQSGLLVKSFLKGLQADVGFQKKNMLLAQFALGMNGYDANQAGAFLQTLQERTLALPGVKQVSLARRIPLSLMGGGASRQVTIPSERTPQKIKYNLVGLNYFQAMGTGIFAGRDFVPIDLEINSGAVIVNSAFARRYWPEENPIGKIIRIGDSIQSANATVVGIAQNGPINRIGEDPEPYMYLPLPKGYGGELTMLVETAGDPVALARPFREAIRAIDKTITPYLLSSLREVVRQGLYDRELMAAFMGSFGLLGLILASFGLYGIVSYSVSQRTSEIGLRMALGARQRDALIMVLRQGLFLSLIGTSLGIPLSFAASYSLQSAFYQVSPADPSALAGTALLLILVALLASYIPARRAARVDPMMALRHQ